MGSGKGGGGGGYTPEQYQQEQLYGQAYLDKYADVAEGWQGPAYEHYLRHGQSEGRMWGEDLLGPKENPFAGIEFGGGGGGYDAAAAAAEQERLRQEERRIAGENERDRLYGDYMSAASSATDFINSQIKEEQANARLMGVDYNLSDEQKADRISNYFATIWSEGDQTRLENLFKEWGNAKGFEDWTITRGDASQYTPREGSEEGVGTATGIKPAITGQGQDEDEKMLGGASILGG